MSQHDPNNEIDLNSPAGLLRHFEDNLIEEMGNELEEDRDNIARQLVIAVLCVVHAAASTAEAVARQEERNESA